MGHKKHDKDVEKDKVRSSDSEKDKVKPSRTLKSTDSEKKKKKKDRDRHKDDGTRSISTKHRDKDDGTRSISTKHRHKDDGTRSISTNKHRDKNGSKDGSRRKKKSISEGFDGKSPSAKTTIFTDVSTIKDGTPSTRDTSGAMSLHSKQSDPFRLQQISESEDYTPLSAQPSLVSKATASPTSRRTVKSAVQKFKDKVHTLGAFGLNANPEALVTSKLLHEYYHDGLRRNASDWQAIVCRLTIDGMHNFLQHPLPENASFVWLLKKTSSCVNTRFSMETDEGLFLMVGKKRFRNAGLNLEVYLDPDEMLRDGESYVGKLRGHGDSFNAYGDGINPRDEAKNPDAVVRKQLSAFQLGKGCGPNLSFDVALPKIENQTPIVLKDSVDTYSHLEYFRQHEMDLIKAKKSNSDPSKVMCYRGDSFKSKKGPVSDPKICLGSKHEIVEDGSLANYNFNLSRVSVGGEDSDLNGRIDLSFAATKNGGYTCKVRAPLSPFQAFSIICAVLTQ